MDKEYELKINNIIIFYFLLYMDDTVLTNTIMDSFKYVPDDFIRLFFFVSHGSNVSSRLNLYPIESKFKRMLVYSDIFEAASSTDYTRMSLPPKLSDVESGNVCKLVTGSCPYPNVIDKETGKTYVDLPPLLFYVYERDLENRDFKHQMGLFYLEIRKTGMSNAQPRKRMSHDCELNVTQIYKLKDLIHIFGNDTPFTYSSIFQLVEKECKTMKLNPNDVLLGIFSCQSILSSQSGHDQTALYNQTDPNLLLSNKIDLKLIPQAKLITGLSNDTLINLFIIEGDITAIKKSYNSDNKYITTKITTQGCGLNILSFYGFISQTYANEQTVCLTKGTSIFKILDYINLYVINKIRERLSFLVVRFPFDIAKNILFENIYNHLFNQANTNPQVIIFKIYKKMRHEGEFSHFGHTVSFFVHNRELHFIDFQLEQYIKITDIARNFYTDFHAFMLNFKKKYEGFEYVDLIFTEDDDFKDDNKYTFEKLVLLTDGYKGTVVPRPKNINYGGKKYKKNSKTKKYKLKNNKTKNYRFKKNKQSGGKLDNFEKIMIDIDKKNKISTIIQTDDI